jgi:hypothetical protein
LFVTTGALDQINPYQPVLGRFGLTKFVTL